MSPSTSALAARPDGADPVATGLARVECEARLEAGHSMRAVEDYIGSLPVDDHVRRSLWTWAWAYGERTPPR